MEGLKVAKNAVISADEWNTILNSIETLLDISIANTQPEANAKFLEMKPKLEEIIKEMNKRFEGKAYTL